MSAESSSSREPSPKPPDDAAPAGDAHLFQNVLQQTFLRAGSSGPPPADSPTWQALRQVARRFAGMPLVPEPIVAELVKASLGARLTATADRPADMIRQITETLWNDPTSHERLQALWTQLSCEAS